MKRELALVVSLSSLLVSGGAHAAVDVEGSDALARMVDRVLVNCIGARDLHYLGGGSDAGEQALLEQRQEVAPMSRFLEPRRTCQWANPQSSGGFLVALSAAAVVASEASRSACTGEALSPSTLVVKGRNQTAGLQCPGCDGAGYRVADYRDALRLLYFGIHHDPAQTRDCDSDARRALVSDYQRLFPGGCTGACAGQPLRHAWRREDASDVNDTFVRVLGLPSAYELAGRPAAGAAQRSNPFCNAGAVTPRQNFNVANGDADFLDLDPIRVPCRGNGSNAGEQVCQPDGTLGLVLPIVLPAGPPPANLYPTAFCTPGEQELLPSIKRTYTGLCPNGAPSFGGKCFASVIRNADGTFNANCMQVNKTGACPFLTPTGADCRGANLWPRSPDGALLMDTSLGASTPRFDTGAFYRLHATQADPEAPSAAAGCRAASADAQIGCLVAGASPCSVGLGALGAAQASGARGLPVAGIAPTVETVRRLVADPPDPLAYPLASRLYLSSMMGFAAVSEPTQSALVGCLTSPNLVDRAATDVGLVSLGVPPPCRDFDERQCGTTFNTNSCMTRLFDLCPTLGVTTVAPLEVLVGGKIALDATASDADGNPIEFLWTATSGAFDDRSAASTKYTCTSAGPQTITLTIWDGRCPETTEFPVECTAAP